VPTNERTVVELTRRLSLLWLGLFRWSHAGRDCDFDVCMHCWKELDSNQYEKDMDNPELGPVNHPLRYCCFLLYRAICSHSFTPLLVLASALFSHGALAADLFGAP
jgi:hypothetical protein